jgi:hypothetical protein
MPNICVSLHISSNDFLSYYEGAANTVLATASDGRKVRFPARVLRPYLTHDGIDGHFLIQFDDKHKFIGIKKLSRQQGR